ncbi:MAG: GYF domain-containing protein [Myxococcales bacterium]
MESPQPPECTERREGASEESPALGPSPEQRPATAFEQGSWYFERRLTQTGPCTLATLQELAGLGALSPDDRVREGSEGEWMRADSVSELEGRFVRSQPPAASRAWHAQVGPTWVALTGALVLMVFELVPTPTNGLLRTRLQVFGSFGCLLAGLWALPWLWRRRRRHLAETCLRIAALGLAFLVLVLCASYVSNGRDQLKVAVGSDPFGDYQLALLPGGRELELSGSFGAGIAAAVIELLDQHPEVRVLHLNSPGGWVAEGVQLSEAIRTRGLDTYSATGCYSACVLAFGAGKHRSIQREARLGLHSAWATHADPVYSLNANENMKRELLKLGASIKLVDQAISISHENMWFPLNPYAISEGLLDAEVDGLGFATSGESNERIAQRIQGIQAKLASLKIDERSAEQKQRLHRSLLLAYARGALPWEIDALLADYALGSPAERHPVVVPASTTDVLEENEP